MTIDISKKLSVTEIKMGRGKHRARVHSPDGHAASHAYLAALDAVAKMNPKK